MVGLDGIRECDPERTRDELRLVTAFRALPAAVRIDALRDLELRSFNYPRKPDNSTPGDHQ